MTEPHAPAATATPAPDWQDADLRQLAGLLDAIPAPLEPLDVGMLDGFLTAVALLPKDVPPGVWWPHVIDVDARPLPAGFDAAPLRELVVRRRKELAAAIDKRQWFDPWVFELEEDEDPLEALTPWVAGFALAVDAFPSPMQDDGPDLLEPLALIYRALDTDDLQDADALLEVIEQIEPPTDLPEAVEDLVTAVLRIADVTRPHKRQAAAPAAKKAPPARGRRGRR